MIPMADEIDLLTAQQEMMTDLAIQEIRRNAGTRALPFKGACYNCGEPLESENYCDIDCVKDHRDRLAASRRKSGDRPMLADE